MRFLAFVLLFLVGCQTSRISHDEQTMIEKWLQRRITPEEARHICLDDSERLLQWTQSRPDGDEARKELAAVKRMRQRMSSRLESFLSRSPKEAELWFYQKGAKVPAEDGIAFVRAGRVLDYLAWNIYD
jgi:hypothetical protein